MPIYCFTTDDGETVEELFPIDDHPDTVTLDDGRRAVRDMTAEGKGGTRQSANWPFHCYSVGVGESQREEAMAHSRKIGIPTEFDEQGDAVFTSQRHFKEYCEHPEIGYFHRNAGHGDPLPQNRT